MCTVARQAVKLIGYLKFYNVCWSGTRQV